MGKRGERVVLLISLSAVATLSLTHKRSGEIPTAVSRPGPEVCNQ